MPSLTALLAIPAGGALLIALLPRDAHRLVRGLAIGFAGAALAYAWALLRYFDTAQAGLQFFERTEWNTRLGTAYALGIDGFSFPMVLLATLLCLIAILASASITERAKGYFSLVLLLESAMFGVFIARDWSLFYVFWERR